MKMPLRSKETMELLDKFAGEAMQSLIISNKLINAKVVVENAYEFAELMLEARESHTEEIPADFGEDTEK